MNSELKLTNFNNEFSKIYNFLDTQLNTLIDNTKEKHDEIIKISMSHVKTLKLLNTLDIKVSLVKLEILKGQFAKYEVATDIDENFLLLSRFAQLSYPTYYGGLIGTKGGDEDEVDALILGPRNTPMHHLQINTLLYCIPFAAIKMIDNNEEDTKILTIPMSCLADLINNSFPEQILHDSITSLCYFLSPLSAKLNKHISIEGIMDIYSTVNYINKAEDLFLI